jgi:hypothetical protein
VTLSSGRTDMAQRPYAWSDCSTAVMQWRSIPLEAQAAIVVRPALADRRVITIHMEVGEGQAVRVSSEA